MTQPLLRRSGQLQDEVRKTQGLKDCTIAPCVGNDMRPAAAKLLKCQRLTRLVRQPGPSLGVRKQMVETIAQEQVAPHQTVVRCSCKANGGPDILLVAMFSTHSQEERHGPHDDMLPQRELSCQRPERPGQYRYPFAEGAAVHLSCVSHNLQRTQRHRLLSAAHFGRDGRDRRDLARPWLSRGVPT